MKSLIITLTVLTSFAATAAPKLCPAGTKEVLACTAKSSIPIYPYVSICENSDGSNLIVMNSGAGRSPDILKADKAEDASTLVFTANEEDSDGVVLTYSKGIVGAKKTNAILVYNILMGEVEDEYRCTQAQ